MNMRDKSAGPPSPERVDDVLLQVAEILGHRYCWLYAGAYHFAVADGWTIAVAPESASRFRVSACRDGRAATTLWANDGDDARLAALVTELDELVRTAVPF